MRRLRLAQITSSNGHRLWEVGSRVTPTAMKSAQAARGRTGAHASSCHSSRDVRASAREISPIAAAGTRKIRRFQAKRSVIMSVSTLEGAGVGVPASRPRQSHTAYGLEGEIVRPVGDEPAVLLAPRVARELLWNVLWGLIDLDGRDHRRGLGHLRPGRRDAVEQHDRA